MEHRGGGAGGALFLVSSTYAGTQPVVSFTYTVPLQVDVRVGKSFFFFFFTAVPVMNGSSRARD